MHITDPSQVEAIRAATHMMVEARRLYPDFDWRAYDPAGRWIDKLTGSTRFRDMLAAGAPADGDRRRLARGARRVRRPPTSEYLLYRGARR